MLYVPVGIIISYFQEVKIEMSAYHYVAMAAASFAFQSSHWNKKCGRSQCILQSAEVTAESEVLQTIIIIQLYNVSIFSMEYNNYLLVMAVVQIDLL